MRRQSTDHLSGTPATAVDSSQQTMPQQTASQHTAAQQTEQVAMRQTAAQQTEQVAMRQTAAQQTEQVAMRQTAAQQTEQVAMRQTAAQQTATQRQWQWHNAAPPTTAWQASPSATPSLPYQQNMLPGKATFIVGVKVISYVSDFCCRT